MNLLYQVLFFHFLDHSKSEFVDEISTQHVHLLAQFFVLPESLVFAGLVQMSSKCKSVVNYESISR